MNVLHIIKPGMLTTVQDLGRWGLQARGVPVAGPMDPVSHRIANAIVGNPIGAATLEVTLLGPEFVIDDARAIAVAGAEFDVSAGGQPIPPRTRIVIPAKTAVRFGAARRGARAYLAVAGGIAVPPTLGSRATHLISAMGGVEGRALRAGDTLPLGAAGKPPKTTPVPSSLTGLPDHHARIRVLPGPQDDYFVPAALDALQSASYSIGRNSDRMGFRLEGPILEHARGADIISDATPLGALQVPASGQPILLMADRQTAGGYPKIATVITADMAVAGQLAPGDRIAFSVCSPREALAALIAQERALMTVEGAVVAA